MWVLTYQLPEREKQFICEWIFEFFSFTTRSVKVWPFYSFNFFLIINSREHARFHNTHCTIDPLLFGASQKLTLEWIIKKKHTHTHTCHETFESCTLNPYYNSSTSNSQQQQPGNKQSRSREATRSSHFWLFQFNAVRRLLINCLHLIAKRLQCDINRTQVNLHERTNEWMETWLYSICIRDIREVGSRMQKLSRSPRLV
jgi:hypothetical protein